MARTLIVPDIHEQLDVLQQYVEPLMQKADRIVFLGDYFDTFKQIKPTAEVAWWIKDHLNDERITWLLGNHDCHYAFDHPGLRCSGFQIKSRETIRNILSMDDWKRFKVFTQVGNFLCSHAGFTRHTWSMATPEQELEALTAVRNGEMHMMFSAGRARGGTSALGGPTWLDWNREMEALPTRPQIVGHTMGPFVGSSEGSYCIDTGLRHVAWVDDAAPEEAEVVGLR